METSLSDLVVVFTCALAVLFGVPLLLWLIHRGPTLAREFVEYFVMLSARPAETTEIMSSDKDEDEGEVIRQTTRPEPPADVVLAGAVAKNHDTPIGTSTPAPRTNKHMADAEIIALLSTVRSDNGKHRFSANEIAALVGGTRKEVLDQVRAVRNLPSFLPITPEQEAQRRKLELTG